jgi:choline-glycine betaine transporter
MAGGLNALQTASVVAGQPMSAVIIGMAISHVKALHEDFPVPNVEDSRDMVYLNR